MPDYSNGKVYVIRNSENELEYVGSTTRTLAQRMTGHRCASRTKDGLIYKAMRELGVDKFYIELLEDCPCERKEQLNKREGEVIREMKTNKDGYNQVVAGRTKKEYYDAYYEANKAEIAVKTKAYNEANKPEIAVYKKGYYEAKKTEFAERAKVYYEANKTEFAEKNKAYYEANKAEIAKKKKAYREANKTKIAAYKKAYREAAQN